MARRIKFIWGGSEVIKGNWFFGLFGLYNRAEGMREDGLAISLRGVVGWGLTMVVVGYFAATAFVFSFWQRSPYCLLTYGDAFFYPVRRQIVAEKKGQAYIAEGQQLIKAGNWMDGARLLRQGLALYPPDLSARISLARFYVLINQRTDATNVLNGGLAGEFPGRSYLQLFLDLAAQSENYDLVVTTADRYLPRLKSAQEMAQRRWLVAQKFAALLAARRLPDALALAQTEEAGSTASEHRVLALLEMGRAAEAVKFLAEWGGQADADLGAVRRLQVRAFREAGNFDEMERACEDLRALSPADPRQAVYGVVQRALAGRAAAASKSLDDFLFRFGSSTANLKMMAEPLAEIGAGPLFDRVSVAAAERGYAMHSFRILRVQIDVQQGDWARASADLALARPAPASGVVLSAPDKIWMDWMTRLIAAAISPGEAPQGALLEFLRGRPWTLQMFKQTVSALRQSGRLETARDVVGIAEAAFPISPWVQTQKTELERERTAKQPTAPPEKTAITVAGPPGEKIFFERLQEFVRLGQWDAAARSVGEARSRQPKPDWLTLRDAEVRLVELQISQSRGEISGMMAMARLYLNGDAGRTKAILDLAEKFYAAGDPKGAQALVREVLNRTPENKAAALLQAKWQPAPAAIPDKK